MTKCDRDVEVWRILDNLDTVIHSEAYDDEISDEDLKMLKDQLYEAYKEIGKLI